MRLRIFVFTQLVFYVHYFGDYFFTTWPPTFFFPFSRRTFLAEHAFPVWHSANDWLGGALMLRALGACFYRRRTPVEVVSPQADTVAVHWIGRLVWRAAWN